MKILKLLEQKPLCVCELQTALEIPQPTVSSHMRILQNTNMINSHKDGLWIIYQLAELTDVHINALVKNALKHLTSDKEIRVLINKLKKIDRFDICNTKRKGDE
ncbi:MAG: helix-turn-helix transcriptional regulator [Gammaproteobacteria bacterium]|nr:helix-turn-helix transcriptional regulator [Gammaproteobacteria bacterium]